MNTTCHDVALVVEPVVAQSALGIERLGDEIAELSAHLDAATAHLLDLIREFDAREGWGNGFRSCAHWLNWRVGLALGAAREHVRVARALGTLPGLRQALAGGQLSYSKVRALTRVATPATEERLLGVGRAGTAEHVERIVRGWRQVDRIAEAEQTARRHKSRALNVYQDDDGMVVVHGRLEPELGAVLMRALEAARETLYQRARVINKNVSAGTCPDMPTSAFNEIALEPPSFAQQQADALGVLAETALHHGMDAGTSGERYQVVVHVDAAVLEDPDAPGQSALEGGVHVSAETARRLACDASRVVMRHGPDDEITEIGALTRTIPPALRRALQYRDRGCRFPGCGLPPGQGHHIQHWANGGPTTLSNLALLCHRHHRSIHEDGYTMQRLADGTLRFWRPDGRVLPDVPVPAPVPIAPVETLRARHDADGLAIHSRTAVPLWQGEYLNVGYAIDVLHPRAADRTGSNRAETGPQTRPRAAPTAPAPPSAPWPPAAPWRPSAR
jgi:hypothetical protein